MKHLRNVVCALFLTTVLAFVAVAGEIQNPGVTTPTPPPAESSIAGEIQNPGFTGIIFDMAASILALL